MLKFAIYFNVLMLLIMSIIFMIRTFMKKDDLNAMKKLVIVYMIFNFISIYLCYSGKVDTGWDLIFLYPASVITFIIQLVTIRYINGKIPKSNNTNNKLSFKYIFLTIIPAIIVLVPYIYELYLLTKCNYLLEYNYQNGIVQSDYTYIAVVDNKPFTLTLQKNLFIRKGSSTEELRYNVIYTNGIEISEKDSNYENIMKIALNAKEKCSSAKGAHINYFPEGKFAIIELLSEENYGTVLAEYFYYDNTYIQSIKTTGTLISVIRYK